MTTNELKSYIDRTIGNSLRCILPSYWWKRMFGAVIDKTEEITGKLSAVDNRLNNFSKYLIVPANWDGLLTNAQQQNNRELYSYLSREMYRGLYPMVPQDVNIHIIEEGLSDSRVGRIVCPSCITPISIGIEGIKQLYSFNFDTEKYVYTLAEDGTVVREKKTDGASGVDELKERLDDLESEITDCVTETEMNRAIAETLTNTLNTEV